MAMRFTIGSVLLGVILLAGCGRRATTEEGLASYYANSLHGNPTASGEPYDKAAFTAAHRTLPFGTRVRVTNIANQKSVVVLINDRGPYVKDRIIDLSYAAAVQIGLSKYGTTQVTIEAVRAGALQTFLSNWIQPVKTRIAAFVKRVWDGETSTAAGEGLASYYANSLHGNPTASGEPYDKAAFTAAHRTLPFGTRVRVTNIANQKSVVVLINDRGPYVEGRIIDLSYAAAEKIDLLQAGVTKVQLDVLP